MVCLVWVGSEVELKENRGKKSNVVPNVILNAIRNALPF